jgi:hypothetical protein
MEKKEALNEIEKLVSDAWRLAYGVSKGQMSGKWYDLRMALNDIQCDINDMQEE